MGPRREFSFSLCAFPSLQVSYRVQKYDQDPIVPPPPSSRNANTSSARANSNRQRSINPRPPRSLRNRKRLESTWRWCMDREGSRRRRGRSRSRRRWAGRRRGWRRDRSSWKSRKRRRRLHLFRRGETDLQAVIVISRPCFRLVVPRLCSRDGKRVSGICKCLGGFGFRLLPFLSHGGACIL